MAKFQPNKVHTIKKVQDEFSGMKINRLIEFHGLTYFTEGEERLAVQDGHVFGLGGDPIPDEKVPGWLLKRIPNMSPKVVEETGLDQLLKRLQAPKPNGAAVEAAEEPKAEEPQGEAEAESEEGLESMEIGELRDFAQSRGIELNPKISNLVTARKRITMALENMSP